MSTSPPPIIKLTYLMVNCVSVYINKTSTNFINRMIHLLARKDEKSPNIPGNSKNNE